MRSKFNKLCPAVHCNILPKNPLQEVVVLILKTNVHPALVEKLD